MDQDIVDQDIPEVFYDNPDLHNQADEDEGERHHNSEWVTQLYPFFLILRNVIFFFPIMQIS